MEFAHKPIMVNEIVELLSVREDMLIVDCTLGGGGHSEAFLKLGARVVGIDRDTEALKAASARLACYGERFSCIHGNFFDIERLIDEKVDGVLADFGVSSYQLDNPERGFSYNQDAPLDMRMDQTSAFCASDVVNGYTESELRRVISAYGEERWAARIAKFIVQARPLNSTFELTEVIKNAIPASARREGPHPAKRTFQAIRIEVNGELENLRGAVESMTKCLRSGGRAAIITFHSLEDRIVKNEFRRLENPCTCPPKTPICICGNVPSVKVLTRKPVVPGGAELEENPRARSAKLRAVEKI